MKKNGGGILEVITFSTTTHQHFRAFLQFVTQQLNFLRVNQFEYELIPKTSQQICLVCHKWPKYLSRSEVIDAFRHYFSVGVAEFIVQELEPILVRNMLIKDYHYTGEKLDSIFEYCQQLLYLD